jgi:predicted transposase YbfD/YdcC
MAEDYDKTVEKNRGRKETRIIHVFNPTQEILAYMPHIKAVVKVRRMREIKGKISEEIVYYISDVKHRAKKFNQGIRQHWSIENKLHWIKDVIMNEDKSGIRNKIIAPNVSILKSLVIELAYLNTNSIINFQRSIAHDVAQMLTFLE